MRLEAPDRSLVVTVATECIEHCQRYRQTRIWHRESGGLMFAPSIGSADRCVNIIKVSGPHSADRRKRTSLRLDHDQCLADIKAQFDRGLHFVGYWHTHPEAQPTLSGMDERALARNLRRGGLEIKRMIAVVVGNGLGSSCIRAYLVHDGPSVLLTSARASDVS